MELTRGTLLDGRVRYDQPASGHRSGIEPVFLAAIVPARPGQRVLEAGAGAGAALLCLASRVPGIAGVAVERDPVLAALAAKNAAANGFAGISVEPGAIEDFAPGDKKFDHAMANPPWHAPAGTASPDPGRRQARQAEANLLGRWIRVLAGALRLRGTLSLVLPPAALPESLAALAEHGCGSPVLWPLWPRPGMPAKLLLLQAMRGGRAPMRLLPGTVLHEADGSFTARADDVLRRGLPLLDP